MKRNILIGMDFGTNGVKALAFNVDRGEIVGSAYKGYPVYYMPPNLAEHDAADWWLAFKSVLADMLNPGTFKPQEINCIALSSHTPTLLAVDKTGQPLCRAVFWADARSDKEAESIAFNLGDAIRKINPAPIRPYHMVGKIEWLRTQKPDIFAKTRCFLQCNTYINYRLTGKFSSDHSMAGNHHFYNIYARDWDKPLCEALHVSLDILPPVSESYDIIGYVNSAAAEETGLSREAAVVAGTTDLASAALGAGIYKEGQLFYSAGTGSNIAQVVPIPKEPGSLKVDSTLIASSAAIPGFILDDAIMTCTGGALKWFRNTLGQPEMALEKDLGIDAYALFDKEAKRTSPGAGGILFLPYLTGEMSPYWDSNAKGVFFGLSDNTTRGEMVRAVMEGSCYTFRQNLENILGSSKTQVKVITATGGPCNSKIWMQALADVNGIQVQTLEKSEGSAVGDIVLAGLGCGLFKNIKDPVKLLVRPGDCYMPRGEEKGKYDELFGVYKLLASSLRDKFAALADWRKRYL